MTKESKQSVTMSDLNVIQTKINVFPLFTSVISDGLVKEENLEKLNLNRQWLDNQLKRSGIDSISDVFYAEI